MTAILGVDFSGAGTEETVGNTWVTQGCFKGNVLRIDNCRRVCRGELECLLKDLLPGSVVALDFPFSVPISFAEFWRAGCCEMPDLWAAASAIELDRFGSMVTAFTADQGFEHLRVGDLLFPNAQPCLHMKGLPNMVPMTFRGMQLLDRLWQTGRFHVPPLPLPSHPSSVLLEVMPGAALRNYGLPFTKYKNGGDKVERKARLENRWKILGNLCLASCLRVDLTRDIHKTCLNQEGADALDSLVAATVAARWARNEGDFQMPTHKAVTTLKRSPEHKRQASAQAMGMTEIQAARLEGWIYAPKPADSAARRETSSS